MRKLLFMILFFLQVPWIFRYLNRNKITIITYHGFTDKVRFTGIENDQKMHLNISAFRRHLKYLVSNYNVISLSDVVAHYRTGKKLPKYSAVVTIDDGYRSIYTLAFPVIKEFKVPASVFIATNFVGNGEPLWYDRVQHAINLTGEPALNLVVNGAPVVLSLRNDEERLTGVREFRRMLKSIEQEHLSAVVENLEGKSKVRLRLDGSGPGIYSPLTWHQVTEMIQSGLVSVGSHTESHIILSRCSPKRMELELSRSKKVIEQMVGAKCDTFCYPNGTEEDFDSCTGRQLEESGYRCGLTTVAGTNDRNSDVLELKRFGAMEDLAEFAVTISGIRLLLSRYVKPFISE